MTEVSIVISTFGDHAIWDELAERAEASARAQTVPCEVIRFHGESLAQTRNRGVELAHGSWIVVLDADDQLGPSYVKDMLKASGDVRFPMITRLYADGHSVHRSYKAGHILTQNFCVVGSMVRRTDFLRVGGFDEEWPMFEDWTLFIKLWLEGLDFQPSTAVYIAHDRPRSRNKQYALIAPTYDAIRAKYIPLAKAKGLAV